MEKCIKCGREIDVIAKNPEKIFFCSRCSKKLMEKHNQKNENEIKISNIKKIYFILLPGTYQREYAGILKSFIYVYGSIILPLFFGLIIYTLNKKEFLNLRIKGISSLFLILIFINSIVIYIENYLELRKEQK